MIYTKKSLLLLTALIVLLVFDIRAQQSIISLFNASKNAVDSLERKGMKIDHVGFNILTLSDKTEESRNYFDKSNSYFIGAFGSPNLVKIKIELLEDHGNELKLIREGQSYISHLTFKPEKSESLIIKVTGEEFANGKSNGRYYVIIGSKKVARPIVFTIIKREEIEYNPYDKKTRIKNTKSFSSKITIANTKVVHDYNSNADEYTISEYSTTAVEMKNGLVVYGIKDDGGKDFRMTINAINNTIEIMQITIEPGKKTVPVQKYYYN